MALCKWQPGPFSHSSQLSQPLTSQRQEQLAQPVPLEKSAQSSQPDYCRNLLRTNGIRVATYSAGGRRSAIVRIVGFTTCLTIMISILNITVDWVLRATPRAANSRCQKASRETTILPMNRVACSRAENTGSIGVRSQHSVASLPGCWYGLFICKCS